MAPVVVPSGEPLIFPTTVAPRFPVTSPVAETVSAVLPTPLTVLTSWLVPFCVSVFVLMIFTVAPATPFTVVRIVLALDVLEMELIILTEEPVTPLTVVVNVFAELVLLTLFTAGAVTDTPFTTDVMVFVELLSVWVVVLGVQAVPFQFRTCPLAGAVDDTLLPWSWFAFQYAPVLLMVVVLELVVAAAAVVACTAFSLPLKLFQSAEESVPLLLAEAAGRLKV